MTMNTPRSFLFVPGDRADRFDKAVASGAHAVILDLEDAVAGERKSFAREAVAIWASEIARAKGAQVVVRINALGTSEHEDDLRCVAQLPASVGLMLAKAEPCGVSELALDRIPARSVIALVETVAGILGLRLIAGAPGVSRIAFGNVDFALDAGMTPAEDQMELAAVRSALVLESRFSGLLPPIDGVLLETIDVARITAHAHRAKRTGFGAKLCIHPEQVAAVNLAFAPSQAELDGARRVVAAFRTSNGAAVALDGKMIDAPVVETARKLLATVGE